MGPLACNKQLIEIMEMSKADEMECHRPKRGCAQTWRRSRLEQRLLSARASRKVGKLHFCQVSPILKPPRSQTSSSSECFWMRSCAPGPCARRRELAQISIAGVSCGPTRRLETEGAGPPACGPRPLSSWGQQRAEH